MVKKQEKPPKCIGYNKISCSGKAVREHLCTACLGDRFENEVADLFEIMGFSIAKNRHMAGRQVDLLVNSTIGIVNLRCIIECKYHTNANVSVEDVSQAVATANPLLRDRQVDKAYIVTTKGFAPAARSNAEANGIICVTYDELLANLIDFKPYLKRIVDLFPKEPLHDVYIDIKCKRSTNLLGQLQNRSWKKISRPLRKYVSRWIDFPHSHHLTILGDFGSGKTSFCKYFAYLQARRHLRNPQRHRRIPLLIRLGSYARLEKASAQAMITDFLVNECNITTNYSTFKKFMSAGKLLLLLDGFDEMAMQVDERTRLRNFEVLAELSLPPNKVILTGRPGYFPDFKDMRKAMGGPTQIESPYERAGRQVVERKYARPTYEILSINPFSERQIRRFLCQHALQFQNTQMMPWKDLAKTIEKTYNLRDLARRPVLLDIIVQTVPRLSGKVTDLNLYKLYELYTNMWLEREWKKGEMRHLISTNDRKLFMEALASNLYSTNRSEIHYSKLPQHIQSHFSIEKKSMLDYFEHDIRTCAFLSRSDDGMYRFAHKSFLGPVET